MKRYKMEEHNFLEMVALTFVLLLLDGQVVEQGRVLRLQLSHGTFEVELGRGVEWLLGQGAGRRGQRGRWGQEPGQGHAPVVLLGGDVVGCVLPLAAGSALRGQPRSPPHEPELQTHSLSL